jgi:hypothetical protein
MIDLSDPNSFHRGRKRGSRLPSKGIIKARDVEKKLFQTLVLIESASHAETLGSCNSRAG